MRKKIIVNSDGKEFIVGELTVEQYLKLKTEDPNEILDYDILIEFNDKKPNLSKVQKAKLIDTLFGIINKPNLKNIVKKQSKKDGIAMKDFHILVGIVMKTLNQPYTEIMKMPVRYFNKLLKDIEIIIGQKEYKKDRHKTTIDKQGLEKQFGKINGKKSIKDNL